MENSDHDEPGKKRPHLLSPVSSRMFRNSSNHSPNSKNADAEALQLQNQKLVQQTEIQKQALQDLEEKTRELKQRQNSYDDLLIAFNQHWEQLVADMAILGIQAGRDKDSLQTLDYLDNPQGSLPPCPPNDLFLCKLIQKDSIEGSSIDEITNFVEKALALRQLSTRELLELIHGTVDDQMKRIEDIDRVLHGDLSTEDVIIQISKIDDMTKKEVDNFCEVIKTLHTKHREYTADIQNYIDECVRDQSDIKRLKGELDEIVAELEESRRKLISLKMQKDAAMGMNSSSADAVNGNVSPEKPADRAMGLPELKNLIEESKIVDADRLSELQDAREKNQILTKQFQELQNELNDDKYVRSSRVYSLANDQLQHWIMELDRYKSLVESLQAGRANIAKWEKELNLKLDSCDNARRILDNFDSKTDDLELQLEKCIIEKNHLEIKMEEAKQDTGRKDIKSEFRVMASALSKEMGMMEAQLKRWKDAALEAVSLREKAHSLRAELSGKTSELKSLANKCAEQVLEIKSSKALIEKLQQENHELEFVLDMYGGEDYQKSLPEVRDSESKARSQAEMLKNALDEHGLELRVRAANEAEAACEQRLSAAEAEKEELRAQLDETERKKSELAEAIKVKEAAALCMVLYGYDASVFNSLQGSDNWFEWVDMDPVEDTYMLGLINTSYTIGAIISGFFMGGPLADYMGRRWGMFIGCFITIIATFMQTFTPHHQIGVFIAGRVLIGIGQGLALTAAPVYIGEVAPANIRGKVMTIWQMNYSVGSFIAYWINYACSNNRESMGQWDWKMVVIFQILVPAIVCISVLWIPETPRWHIQKNGNVEAARAALARIRETEQEVEEELLAIRGAIEYEKEAIRGVSYSALFWDPSVRKRIILAFLLNIGQQLSGQGTLNSYSTTIYKNVWSDKKKINLINALNATFGIIFTLNAMWTSDRYGRRWLLMVGAVGMGACMLIVAVVGLETPTFEGNVKSESVGIAIVFLFFLFAFFYKPSWGATVWMWTAEVFSMNIRAQAVGMCSQMQNVANTIFQQFFPTFFRREGLKCLFFFMAINFCLAAYVYFFIPETKQVPLEEIDTLFGGASHAAKGGDMLEEKAAVESTAQPSGVEVENTSQAKQANIKEQTV